MTYSCSDFMDDITSALDLDREVTHSSPPDDPSEMADLCLAEISRLQVVESVLAGVRADNPEFETGAIVDHADVTARLAKRWPEIAAALAGVPMLPAAEIFVATFETRHDSETRVFHDAAGVEAWRREIVADRWSPLDGTMPANPEEAADVYFDAHNVTKGDFFRTEKLPIRGPVAPSPGIDWRAIAQDLAGALNSCAHQIDQMKSDFDDDDGTIAGALDWAESATAGYDKAGKIAPDAPATRKVWTCTTDGDNCPLSTTLHATEAEALERVRDDLRADCKPSQLASLEAMPAADLADAWTDKNDGACIIEEHDLPA